MQVLGIDADNTEAKNEKARVTNAVSFPQKLTSLYRDHQMSTCE